jgi:undecaprenyl-diphosphatase
LKIVDRVWTLAALVAGYIYCRIVNIKSYFNKHLLMDKKAAQVTEKAKSISLRVIVVLAIFALFILVLFLITDRIVLDKETAFDESVFGLFSGFQSPAVTSIMIFFTFFGSTKFLLPAYVLLSLYFILFKKNTARSLNIAAIGISSGLLLKVIKNIFQRHRPPHPLIENVGGFSYPSGHSFSSFTFAGVLIYMLWDSSASKAWKIIGTVTLLLFAALVASSRVYLHVHYASDVLAGFCLSFVWLTLCIYILKKINRKGNIEKTASLQTNR